MRTGGLRLVLQVLPGRVHAVNPCLIDDSSIGGLLLATSCLVDLKKKKKIREIVALHLFNSCGSIVAFAVLQPPELATEAC